MATTIKDVARIAGTSISTVSKVINGSGTISEQTINRVNEAIKSLNYIPNNRARNLAKKSNQIVAFITKAKRDTAFINPHLFEIMTGAQKTLYQRGYSMEFFGIKHQDFDMIKQMIDTKSVDGMILHASIVTPEIADYLVASNIPHTVIGMPNFPTSACWIDNNNTLSGQLAAKHLLTIGKENIAYISGEKDDLISELRLKGVYRELKDNFIELNEDFVMRTNSTHYEGYEATLKLLSLTPRPNAIICANNMIDLGCINALRDQNINIPDDIAVVTFDDYPYAIITNPPTTAINIDVYDLGQQAARLVIEKIKKPTYQFQTYMTVPLLVTRKSTRKD
ncbi:MAG: LacI family DNA-binding transcriptional regulator [Candidatus Izemoplasmataceae bacterium]